MKNISQLPADLQKFLSEFKKEATVKLAEEGSKAASQKAPVDTGFLKTQVWGYADGKLVHAPTNISEQKTIVPSSPASEGVSIVNTAGRTGKDGLFDYAAYLGIYNPAYQKTGVKHWLEQVLDPSKGLTELYITAAYKTVYRGNK